MGKIKTHSGTKKRIKRLKSGLFKAAHSGRRKLLEKKSAKRKRELRSKLYICKADRCRIAVALPR